MKRYWLFIFGAYHPVGGMADFAGQYDSVPDALAALNTIKDEYGELRYDAERYDAQYHILDTQEMKIVSWKYYSTNEDSDIKHFFGLTVKHERIAD